MGDEPSDEASEVAVVAALVTEEAIVDRLDRPVRPSVERSLDRAQARNS